MKIDALEIPDTCLYAARERMTTGRRFSMADIVRLVQVPYGVKRTAPQRDWLRKQIAAQLVRDWEEDGTVLRMEPVNDVDYWRYKLGEPPTDSRYSPRRYGDAQWPYRSGRKY